jgi:nucleotide-binding universal stress UspA family protein
MTILVPVDGSKNALRAVDYAIAQARRGRAEVHVLNVQPHPEQYGMVLAYLDRKQHRQLRMEHASEILQPAVARLERARVSHRTHVVFGDVAPAIVRTSRRLRCGSIVMGTRGMGSVGSLILGSVATKVIHLVKVPVTLVR